ncbi:ATP-binding protein [Actinomycetospora cinnamomea]|uniref:ATP-binding protein n=1 Tax=Actinomycetospora cinnamomea TaxID=663609 RepID=UPI0014024A00|nr:LuxR family transcriptional regulator [Actinomycetospora cinnamomea]
MEPLRCPVLVGRDTEVAALRRATTRAAQAHGGVAVVSGTPGVGKSRLARDAAALAPPGWARWRGRCAPTVAPSPLRPWAEAFSAGWRGREPPDVPHAAGLRPALELLVPAWARPPVAAPSPVLLGEAARLLLAAGASAGEGTLVVLEDLHDADPESVDLLGHLSEALDGTRVLVVATTRPRSGTAALDARALAARVELEPLGPEDVCAMVAATLAPGRVAAEVTHAVLARAGGVPLVVEELLGAWRAAGALVRRGVTWQLARPVPAAVPATLVRSIADRLAVLDPRSRTTVEAAAVLGEGAPWTSVAAVLDDREPPIAQDAAASLLVPGEPEVRFHHGLVRDAVLESMPAARVEHLAARAVEVLDAAALLEDPAGAAAPALSRTAELAERAAHTDLAFRLLVAASRGALAQGAVGSAVRNAERAATLAPSPRERVDADRALLDADTAAGDPARIRDRGAHLLARLDALDAPLAERAEVHRRLAAAAVAGSAWDVAATHLDAAERLGADGPADLARTACLRAEIALGRHRLDEAAEHAAAAQRLAVRCAWSGGEAEALLLRGRARRMTDLDEAAGLFSAAVARAELAGDELLRARALLELGTVDVIRCGPTDHLERARALGEDLGAVGLVATTDLQLAVLAWKRAHWLVAREATERAATAGERHGLGLLVPLARIIGGCVDAVAGHREAAHAAFEAARPEADAEIEASGRGNLLAVAALAVEDREGALDEFARAEALAPSRSSSARSPYRGLHALALAVVGDAAAAEVTREVASLPVVDAVAGGCARWAAAVLAGREGEAERARALAEAADRELAASPWPQAMARRLAAEAALDDGWGDPARWLEEAHTVFESVGAVAPARACRSLHRRTGAPPLHRAPTPERWAGIGLTARESEVLALVAEGHSNREIAARLYVSPRTVEKHVERLLAKTATSRRSQLTALALRLDR